MTHICAFEVGPTPDASHLIARGQFYNDRIDIISDPDTLLDRIKSTVRARRGQQRGRIIIKITYVNRTFELEEEA